LKRREKTVFGFSRNIQKRLSRGPLGRLLAFLLAAQIILLLPMCFLVLPAVADDCERDPLNAED
jgi:hypothetical protein